MTLDRKLVPSPSLLARASDFRLATVLVLAIVSDDFLLLTAAVPLAYLIKRLLAGCGSALTADLDSILEQHRVVAADLASLWFCSAVLGLG